MHDEMNTADTITTTYAISHVLSLGYLSQNKQQSSSLCETSYMWLIFYNWCITSTCVKRTYVR